MKSPSYRIFIERRGIIHMVESSTLATNKKDNEWEDRTFLRTLRCPNNPLPTDVQSFLVFQVASFLIPKDKRLRYVTILLRASNLQGWRPINKAAHGHLNVIRNCPKKLSRDIIRALRLSMDVDVTFRKQKNQQKRSILTCASVTCVISPSFLCSDQFHVGRGTRPVTVMARYMAIFTNASLFVGNR